MSLSRRLVLVCSSLGSGGAERVASLLANHWRYQSHQVTVITLSDTSSDFYTLAPGVERIALGRAASSDGAVSAILKNMSRIYALRRAIRLQRPDCVISFCDTNNILTLLSCINLPATVIVSERINPACHRIGRAWSLLRKLTYPLADAVVVQTSRIRDWITENLRVDPRKVAVIPNPAPSIASETGSTSGVAERRSEEVERLIRSAPTILAVGRLVPQKGFDLLLSAFSGIAGKFPEWRLVILGEGPEKPALQEMCLRDGLEGRVSFAGTVLVTERLLSCAHIFALSSRYEGFPNALLEAMAAGLAVVSFDCPTGPRELIETGKNGLLVPLGQVSMLEASLASLMLDPALRRRLGDSARSIRARYSIAEIGREWMQLLQN